MNENDVISAFEDLCGCLELDPVDVLKVLNAQDWSLKIHEESDEDDYISTAGLKIQEDNGSAEG